MKTTNGIETMTRNVKQTYRRYSDEKKREIVRNILNRPSNIGILEACKIHGINNGQFYVWKKKFGMTIKKVNQPMMVKSTKPMYQNTIRKTTGIHTITLSVEVSSLIELVGLCNHIGQLPKVKTILSVE